MPVIRNNRRTGNVYTVKYGGYKLPNPYGQPFVVPSVNSLDNQATALASSGTHSSVTVLPRNYNRTYKLRNDPNHIPRPRNAFIFFRSTYVATPSATNGEEQQNELSKNAGKAWAMLSDEEKRPFRELAKKEREEHAIKYPGYVYSHKGSSRAQASMTRKMPSSSKDAWTPATPESVSRAREGLTPEAVPSEPASPATQSNSETDQGEPEPFFSHIPAFHQPCISNERIAQHPGFRPYISPTAMLSTLPPIPFSPSPSTCTIAPQALDFSSTVSSDNETPYVWNWFRDCEQYDLAASSSASSPLHLPITFATGAGTDTSCNESDNILFNNPLPHPSTSYRQPTERKTQRENRITTTHLFFDRMGEIVLHADSTSMQNGNAQNEHSVLSAANVDAEVLADLTASYLNLEGVEE